jgi:DDE family transposase
MDSSKKRHLGEQVRRFRARFVQSVGTVLGDVMPAGSLMRWVTEEAGGYRERVYSPLTTLVLFIEQVLGADHSCQDAVARGVSTRVALGQAPCSLNTGPYCRARGRLAVGLIERLGREVGARVCERQPACWRWRGREVKLVDGATVSMPDTAANQARFPQSREQKPGLGFPLARLVAIVSLSCGAVLEWASGPCEGKETGETALLWGLARRLRAGDVVVADRYYAGYFMIALLMLLGVDVVMRQHQRRHTDFRRGERLGVRDHVVSWVRPQRPAWMDEATYEAMPQTLRLREARAGGWTLVSTLTHVREVSKHELLELYRMRWQVELDLRSIKAVMQMDILRCKSPAMVVKEIAVHLAAYNLVRAVMARAAYLGHALPRQLSFKGALQMLNAFEENLRHCPRGRLAIRHAHVLAGIAQLRLSYRPGRVEPRAVKRRPKVQRLLTQPRHILRERLLKLQERQIAACLS